MSSNYLTEEANQELEVLESIYPDDISLQLNGRVIYNLPYNKDWSLHISISSKYPETDRPYILMVENVGLDSKSQGKMKLDFLLKKCDELLKDSFSVGMECLYDFTSKINENWDTYIKEWNDFESSQNQNEKYTVFKTREIEEKLKKINLIIQNDEPLMGWIQSEPIEDRGSTFIAYAYKTDNEEDALIRLSHLKTDNKISKSNHVMVAYRLNPGNKGNIVADCDDDGETAAGSRMLHLLTLMDAQNVIIACARWFTGTHIGPDRFKHINTATRDAIIKGNFSIKELASKSDTIKKKKNLLKK
ncbi:hypothetical protein QEN19_003699 [Hanseniaspora menglaensis]